MPTVNGSDDPGLGDAVAVAYLGVVGQILNVQTRYGVGGQGKEQFRAVFGQRFLAVKGLQNPGDSEAIPQQNSAGDLAIANDDLLVNVAVGFDVGYNLVVFAHRVFVAGYGQLHAHYLQLG